MRGCWAITKHLRFCQRKGDWLLLCNEHRAIGYLIKSTVTILAVLGGIASIYAVLKPDHISEYHITVTTVDERKNAVEANLETSVRSIKSRSGEVWMVDIPASSKPSDGRVRISASNKIDFLQGEAEISLANELNQSVTVVMKKDQSARAVGRVVDKNQDPISVAIVYVLGYEGNTVTTGLKGEFDIAANAAIGEPIRIHVEKPGYGSEDVVFIAGTGSEPIVISRKRR